MTAKDSFKLLERFIASHIDENVGVGKRFASHAEFLELHNKACIEFLGYEDPLTRQEQISIPEKKDHAAVLAGVLELDHKQLGELNNLIIQANMCTDKLHGTRTALDFNGPNTQGLPFKVQKWVGNILDDRRPQLAPKASAAKLLPVREASPPRKYEPPPDVNVLRPPEQWGIGVPRPRVSEPKTPPSSPPRLRASPTTNLDGRTQYAPVAPPQSNGHTGHTTRLLDTRRVGRPRGPAAVRTIPAGERIPEEAGQMIQGERLLGFAQERDWSFGTLLHRMQRQSGLNMEKYGERLGLTDDQFGKLARDKQKCYYLGSMDNLAEKLGANTPDEKRRWRQYMLKIPYATVPHYPADCDRITDFLEQALKPDIVQNMRENSSMRVEKMNGLIDLILQRLGLMYITELPEMICAENPALRGSFDHIKASMHNVRNGANARLIEENIAQTIAVLALPGLPDAQNRCIYFLSSRDMLSPVSARHSRDWETRRANQKHDLSQAR